LRQKKAVLCRWPKESRAAVSLEGIHGSIYLLKLEPYCHGWLQVLKDELNLWIDDLDVDFDPQYCICGYHYKNEYGEEYVEFHVDMNKFIHQEASRRYKFGGTTNSQVKDEEF
jgi:hypothetical protein